MITSKDAVSREDVLELISEEQETYASYERLCDHYGIAPDAMVKAISQEKIKLLSRLLGGKRKLKI